MISLLVFWRCLMWLIYLFILWMDDNYCLCVLMMKDFWWDDVKIVNVWLFIMKFEFSMFFCKCLICFVFGIVVGFFCWWVLDFFVIFGIWSEVFVIEFFVVVLMLGVNCCFDFWLSKEFLFVKWNYFSELLLVVFLGLLCKLWRCCMVLCCVFCIWFIFLFWWFGVGLRNK